MNIKHRLAMLFRRFSPMEERLFSAVRAVLPPEAVGPYDAQVRAINRIQRLPQGTEIDFYSTRGGKVDWSHVALFPRTTEFALAEVRFEAGGRRFKARLTAIGGHIFDFAVTPCAEDIAFSDWEGEPHAVLLGSPLENNAQRPPEPLPDTWIEFLADTPATDRCGWSLNEAGMEYRVALEEGEFLVLGERGGDEFLLYRLEPLPGEFFLQLGADGRPVRLRVGLREWMSSQSGTAA